MPSAEFVVSHKVEPTFRVSKVMGMFDCERNVVEKAYKIDCPIENEPWNIGVIVGASGSGKSTIAKALFSDCDLFQGFDWEADSIIDDFPEGVEVKEICEILSKVGFASVPDWLKPFRLLSTGQKMRAELARLLIRKDGPVVYDEFTSVVDRQVAKIGSAAISKFVRKSQRQFIAVSCHRDILEWLEPDWVLDMDVCEFYRGCLRRPKIQVSVRKAHHREWRLFRDFHYLNADHNRGAHCYIGEIEESPAVWCSVLHFPHSFVKNMKKIHRLVVRPDYQGIGVGSVFQKKVAERYTNKGFRVSIVTSAPGLIASMLADSQWSMTRKAGRVTGGRGILRDSVSCRRATASFEFVGQQPAA